MDFFSVLLERLSNPAAVLQRRRPGRFEPLPDMPASGLVEELANAADAESRETPGRQAGSASTGTDTPMGGAAQTPAGPAESITRLESNLRAPNAAPPLAAERTGDHATEERVGLVRAVEPLGRSHGITPRIEAATGRQHATVARPPILPAPSPADREMTDGGSTFDHSKEGNTVAPPPVLSAAGRDSGTARPSASAATAQAPTPPGAVEPTAMPRSTPEPARQHEDEKPSPAPTRASPKRVLQPLLQPVPPAPPRPLATRGEIRHAAVSPAIPDPTTVHISIGRIEIRAVPAPAKAIRGTPPAAPRLSLDEYLKARNGGLR